MNTPTKQELLGKACAALDKAIANRNKALKDWGKACRDVNEATADLKKALAMPEDKGTPLTSRHEVQMAARKTARGLGHKLGPFETSGFSGTRTAHCLNDPRHYVHLRLVAGLGWAAAGLAIGEECRKRMDS